VPALTKATDNLSEEAQRLLLRGFADKQTAAAISAEILEATGETVAVRTISRRAAEWRKLMELRKAARQRMHDLVAESKEQGLSGAEMIEALAREHLEEHPEALSNADPIQFHKLGLSARELSLKERLAKVREDRQALDARRMKIAEDKEARALEVLKGKQGDKDITPEEQVARIKEIYGLQDAPVEARPA